MCVVVCDMLTTEDDDADARRHTFKQPHAPLSISLSLCLPASLKYPAPHPLSFFVHSNNNAMQRTTPHTHAHTKHSRHSASGAQHTHPALALCFLRPCLGILIITHTARSQCGSKDTVRQENNHKQQRHCSVSCPVLVSFCDADVKGGGGTQTRRRSLSFLIGAVRAYITFLVRKASLGPANNDVLCLASSSRFSTPVCLSTPRAEQLRLLSIGVQSLPSACRNIELALIKTEFERCHEQRFYSLLERLHRARVQGSGAPAVGV